MTYDLCAIGNALVDITLTTDDAFLQANGIVKGRTILVEAEALAILYDRAGSAIEMASGGSAANSLAGFASLGGHAAFMGKTGQDEFGEVFAHDLRALGVHFTTSPSDDLPTGRCLSFVTPDAQRSMIVNLGAASQISKSDIDVAVVQNSAITYLEGYQFDQPSAQDAFRLAAQIAHAAGRKVALTLSDVFCVERHRDAFQAMIAKDVDILFANEAEAKALYQTDDWAEVVARARAQTDIAVLTRSERGALIAAGDMTYDVPAHPVGSVVDTTGAGDLYAAGFLFGMTQGKDLAEAGRIGAIAASEVISHYGPRPQVLLAGLI